MKLVVFFAALIALVSVGESWSCSPVCTDDNMTCLAKGQCKEFKTCYQTWNEGNCCNNNFQGDFDKCMRKCNKAADKADAGCGTCVGPKGPNCSGRRLLW